MADRHRFPLQRGGWPDDRLRGAEGRHFQEEIWRGFKRTHLPEEGGEVAAAWCLRAMGWRGSCGGVQQWRGLVTGVLSALSTLFHGFRSDCSRQLTLRDGEEGAAIWHLRVAGWRGFSGGQQEQRVITGVLCARFLLVLSLCCCFCFLELGGRSGGRWFAPRWAPTGYLDAPCATWGGLRSRAKDGTVGFLLSQSLLFGLGRSFVILGLQESPEDEGAAVQRLVSGSNAALAHERGAAAEDRGAVGQPWNEESTPQDVLKDSLSEDVWTLQRGARSSWFAASLGGGLGSVGCAVGWAQASAERHQASVQFEKFSQDLESTGFLDASHAAWAGLCWAEDRVVGCWLLIAGCCTVMGRVAADIGIFKFLARPVSGYRRNARAAGVA